MSAPIHETRFREPTVDEPRKRWIRRLGACLFGALIVSFLDAPTAIAQCVQMESTVECDGTDSDGFAATEGGLEINVNIGATVENGGSASAISTFDDSTVNVLSGAMVDASGMGVVGVSVDEGSLVNNSGSITSGDAGGIGVTLSDLGFLRNLNGGIVSGGVGGFAVLGDDGSNTIENRFGATIDGPVALGAGDDLFFARPGSTMTGTVDGGGGMDSFFLLGRLVGSDPSSDTLDLDSIVDFERLEVFGGSGDEWELTGSQTFPDGTFLMGPGSLRFGTGTSLGGTFNIEGGRATVDTVVTFADGVSVTDGLIQFSDGADVTGPISISGGAATFGDNVILRDDLDMNKGRTTFHDGSSVTANITATGGVVALEGDAALQGNLSQSRNSSFEVGISGDGNSSSLAVTGNVIVDGTTLYVRRSGTEDLDTPQTFTVLTTSSNITGSFADARGIGPGTGFLAMETLQTANTVQVMAGLDFTAPAHSSNQTEVGQRLNSAFALGPSPEFQSYLDSLEMLDPAGASAALDALNPEYFDAHTSAALATATTLAQLLADRPIRCEELMAPNFPRSKSLAPCSAKGWTSWAQAFGSSAMRNGRPGFKDWSYGGGGLVMGADRKIGDALTATGMLGGSRMALDYDNDGDGSVTSFDVGLALAWNRGAPHVRGVALYGHGWHKSRRKVEYPGFAELNTSDYDSDRVTLLVEGGYEFQVGRVDIEPLVSLEYTYLHEESVSESNGGITALAIDSRSNSLVAAEGGLSISAAFTKYAYMGEMLEWADGVWRPELTASWRQVLNDYDRDTSARLRAAPVGTEKFDTKSEDAQYGAHLGVGVSFQPLGTRNTIHLGYDAFVGNRTLIQSVVAKVRIPL